MVWHLSGGRHWILGVLGLLSMLIVPIAWYAKRRIAQGHIRISLVLFISSILFILSSALLLVRGLDTAIVVGFASQWCSSH